MTFSGILIGLSVFTYMSVQRISRNTFMAKTRINNTNVHELWFFKEELSENG